MTTSANDDDSLDSSPAKRAWFSLAPIDSVLQLKKALFSIRVNVVRNGRASQRDCLPKNLLNRTVQKPQIVSAQRGCPATRTNACTEERLVGIDVSHSAQQLLIQQSALNRSSAATEERDELFFANFQRFHTAGIKAVRVNAQFSEHSRIDESQFAAGGEPGDQVSVLGDLG